MKSLYEPSERLDVNGWLKHKYGSVDIPADQSNMVRLGMTKQFHNSYHWWACNFAYIADKTGQTTLLKPFVGQAIHRVSLDSQLRAGLPGRLVEVKARQLGWTTENVARGLHFILDENKSAFFLVDDEDVAADEATHLNTMLNGLPQWMQPMRRIQSLKRLNFENPNPKDRLKNPGLNSSSQVTVPSSYRGVGGSIFVCISEYAHMDEERQKAVNMGLISALPLTPYTILIIDTTPNGPGDSYHTTVLESVAENPKWAARIENWFGELTAQEVMDGALGIPDSVAKGYPGVMIPAICPWRFHEEYTCKDKAHPRGELPPMRKAHRDELTSTLGKVSLFGGEEEKDLHERYGVSLERLFWRRAKIKAYKFPTEEQKLLAFRQEFLSTIDGAFVDSGTVPFPRDSLDALRRQVKPPIAVGLFVGEDKFEAWEYRGEAFLGKEVHRDKNPWQEVRVYCGPENGEKYTMAIDTDVAYESPDCDATVAAIVRARDRKLVCVYEARVGSYELIKQLYCLYRWYWNCYYAMVTDGMGYDLVRRCIDRGMSNVHYYKRYDKDHPEPTSFPGWESQKSFMRALQDQTLLEYVCHRDRETGKAAPLCIIPDAKTVAEICGLTQTPSGSFKSKNGHDDHADAIEIAWCIANDPYSGLTNLEKREEAQKQEREFNQGFAFMTGGRKDRNHPSLSQL